MKLTLTLAIGALALGTGLAEARGNGPNMLPGFEQLEGDESGSISLEQFQAALEERRNEMRTERGARLFSRIDANNDGVIDAEEYEAFKTRIAERMERRGQGRKGRWGRSARD